MPARLSAASASSTVARQSTTPQATKPGSSASAAISQAFTAFSSSGRVSAYHLVSHLLCAVRHKLMDQYGLALPVHTDHVGVGRDGRSGGYKSAPCHRLRVIITHPGKRDHAKSAARAFPPRQASPQRDS